MLYGIYLYRRSGSDAALNGQLNKAVLTVWQERKGAMKSKGREWIVWFNNYWDSWEENRSTKFVVGAFFIFECLSEQQQQQLRRRHTALDDWKLMIYADRIRQPELNKWCAVILERRLYENIHIDTHAHTHAERVAYVPAHSNKQAHLYWTKKKHNNWLIKSSLCSGHISSFAFHVIVMCVSRWTKVRAQTWTYTKAISVLMVSLFVHVFLVFA